MKTHRQFIFIVIISLFSKTTFAHKEKWDDDRTDWSLLMKAIYKGNNANTIELIKKGAYINYRIKSRWHLAAFDVAVNSDNIEAVKLLLSTDSIEAPAEYIWSACVFSKKKDIVELLFKNKGNANDTSNIGYSILMRAVQGETSSIVKFLLEQGAKPNQQTNNNGMSALMFATLNGNIEIINLLLLHGAHKYLKSSDSKTAYDYINLYSAYEYKNPKKKTIAKMELLMNNPGAEPRGIK